MHTLSSLPLHSRKGKMLSRSLFSACAAFNGRLNQLRHGTSIPIILLQDIPEKGVKGEIIKVKRGFARNYLIPRKLAIYAIHENKVKYCPNFVDRRSEQA